MKNDAVRIQFALRGIVPRSHDDRIFGHYYATKLRNRLTCAQGGIIKPKYAQLFAIAELEAV